MRSRTRLTHQSGLLGPLYGSQANPATAPRGLLLVDPLPIRSPARLGSDPRPEPASTAPGPPSGIERPPAATRGARSARGYGAD